MNHFEHLRDIAITTLCHVSDEDLESQFSDDDAGTDSIIALLEIGVANFEDESLVRDEFYEHWSHMRCLYIVDDKARRQPHEPGEKPFWYPDDETITGEDAVFGVEKLSYDREGFLDLFSFPRPVSYCDEAYDPPFYRPMSRHEREDKVSFGLQKMPCCKLLMEAEAGKAPVHVCQDTRVSFGSMGLRLPRPSVGILTSPQPPWC